jgi:hypothetical protein
VLETGPCSRILQRRCLAHVTETKTYVLGVRQAQLRGMIGDFKGGDETAVAQALEAFDILGIALAEYKTAVKGEAPAQPATQAAQLQPSGAANPFQVSCHLPVALALQETA